MSGTPFVVLSAIPVWLSQRLASEGGTPTRH